MCHVKSYLKCNIFKIRSDIKVEILAFSYLIPILHITSFPIPSFVILMIFKEIQKSKKLAESNNYIGFIIS